MLPMRKNENEAVSDNQFLSKLHIFIGQFKASMTRAIKQEVISAHSAISIWADSYSRVVNILYNRVGNIMTANFYAIVGVYLPSDDRLCLYHL